MATTYYLPTYTDTGASGENGYCLLDASLQVSSGGTQLAHPGDTLTFRYKLKSDGGVIGECNYNQDLVSCTSAISCMINGVAATPLNPTTTNNYYLPGGVNQRNKKLFRRNQVAADGIYECVFTLDPAASELKFSSPTSGNGPWVGLHTYPYNGTGHGWAYMIPFNLVIPTLEYAEEDKIRLDLATSWPNPFGDSTCWICDVLTGMWRLEVKKSSAPASLGYGWNLGGHNISVAEDSNPDPVNKDMVLQDGTGSFERWKKNPDGSYSPRYKNNFSTLVKDSITGLVSITSKDKVVMNFDAAGKLATVVDRNGNTTTYSYSSGRLSSIDDGEGRVLTYVYSGPATDGRPDDGQPYQILTQDPGRLTTFTYDSSNRLHQVVNAMGETVTLDYYADNSLWKKTDARGKVEVEYTYESGKVKTETRYGERRFTYTYNGLSLTVKDEDLTQPDPSADARISVYNYNDRYRLTSMTDPLGNQIRREYNDPNNPYLMTKSIDPNQATSDYS